MTALMMKSVNQILNLMTKIKEHQASRARALVASKDNFQVYYQIQIVVGHKFHRILMMAKMTSVARKELNTWTKMEIWI